MYPVTVPQIIDLISWGYDQLVGAATGHPLILIGLGVGLGVVGIGAVAIWSAIESWRMREARKPIVVQ